MKRQEFQHTPIQSIFLNCSNQFSSQT